MNKAQKALKKYMEEGMISVDKVTCRADGTVELRRGYFYRHGDTAQLWGEWVAEELPKGWRVATTKDEWRVWPKGSWFVAIVEPVVEREVCKDCRVSLIACDTLCDYAKGVIAS